jgi:peptide/nickel transport system substrate-binding protein
MSNNEITRRATLIGMASLPLTTGGLEIVMAQAEASAAAGEPKNGGTMNMLIIGEPLTLVALTSLTTLAVTAKVTEGLLEYGHDMEPRSQLATAWEVSPDGLRYTFKLREGVKWHDGKPFTSADVQSSINLLKTAHPRGRQTFANVVRVELPDEHTAVIVLEKPVPYMINAFAAAESPMMPKHLYEGVEPASSPNSSAPVGTGPFKFKEWVRGSHVVYERNPNYWDAPKPYLDQLIVRFVPDANARSIALETGASDLGYRTPVGLGDLKRLEKTGNLNFEPQGYEYSSNITSMTFNLENKYFSNPKVRQAIAHAINRDVMVKTVFYGYATPCPSPIVPTLKPFHSDQPSPYPYDIEKAKQLLDEAGLPVGADGKRFSFSLDAMPIQTDPKRLAEYIRGALMRIGVGVDIRLEDSASYVRRVYAQRQFDAALAELSNLYDPIVGVRRLYWSKNIVQGLPFSNASHFRNDRVDEILEQTAVESDRAKRIEMFKEFQTIVMTELPDINLCMPNWLTIHNPKLQGHSVTADGVEGNFASVHFTT